MYLPRIRTITEVVDFFKSQDAETAVTKNLLAKLVKDGEICSVRIGSKLLVNLDECISFFKCNADIQSTTSQLHAVTKRSMHTTGEIARLFLAHDQNTRVRRSMVKSAIATKQINGIWLYQGYWLIDIQDFINILTNGKTFATTNEVPRIRNYEKSYHTLQSEYPNSAPTWNQLHTLTKNKTVTTYYHGNRWIVNLDEIIDTYYR
ncbi:MAG: hypothetical protein R3Y45_04730 [Bacillota bacterium]